MKKIIFCLLVVFCFGFVGSVSAEVQYEVTLIKFPESPDFTNCRVTAINNDGTIVGYNYGASENYTYGWMYKNGEFIKIEPINIIYNAGLKVYDVNENDQVVGSYATTDGESSYDMGFIYDNGNFTYIGQSKEPYAINDYGEVVGLNREIGSEYDGFFRAIDGTITLIKGEATDINNNGYIVGRELTTAFLLKNDIFQYYYNISGADGVIWYNTQSKISENNKIFFVKSEGFNQPRELMVVDADNNEEIVLEENIGYGEGYGVTGVNDLGDCVGFDQDGYTYMQFMYVDGVYGSLGSSNIFNQLNDVFNTDTTNNHYYLVDINNQRVIVGVGNVVNDYSYIIILTPITETPNQVPTATTNINQTITIGETAPLNGSASTDPENEALDFAWSVVSSPAGSTAEIADDTAEVTTFTPDVVGVYEIQLIVTDASGLASAPATLTITVNEVPNEAPEPVTTGDESSDVGGVATVGAGGSTDTEGNYPLSYLWTLVAPDGSTAELDDATAVTVNFNTDVPGDYILTLVVTDSLGNASEPVTTTITTENAVPTAEAGADQTVTTIGATVTLDGSQSSDQNDNQTLSFLWENTTKPACSSAVLSDTTAVNPTFVYDCEGVYEFTLIVSDGYCNSTPDTVTVTYQNVAPIAKTNGDQSINLGETAQLLSLSTDANGDSLTNLWAITTQPDGANASLSDATIINPVFSTDTAGEYVVSLIVNDGELNSEPVTLTVVVLAEVQDATDILQNAITVINAIPTADFEKNNQAKQLTQKISAVLGKIADGEIADAINMLENTVLSRMDGCALRGTPDVNGTGEKKDWVETCSAQASIYPVIVDALLELQP